MAIASHHGQAVLGANNANVNSNAEYRNPNTMVKHQSTGREPASPANPPADNGLPGANTGNSIGPAADESVKMPRGNGE
jgi:hypothetical protein